jgi:hypothetical protein
VTTWLGTGKRLTFFTVYLVQLYLFLIGEQGLGDFFRYRPFSLASHWQEDCANFTQMPEETTNTAPATLIAIQAASQSFFYQ